MVVSGRGDTVHACMTYQKDCGNDGFVARELLQIAFGFVLVTG